MFSPEEAAFIDRIREDNADDLPRLIYADWLDEHGHQPRADFIRVQCALAKMAEDDPNTETLRMYENSLLESYSDEWTQKIGQIVEGLSFRRGMIEAVTVTPRQFLAIGENGYQRYPIRRFRLVELGESAPKIFQSPLMRFVVELDFSQSTLDGFRCATVARARHLRNLEWLDLGFTGIDHMALTMLLHSPVMSRLKTLRLVENRTINADSLRAILTSEHLSELETLDLSGNLMTSRDLDVLLREFDALPNLKFIHLQGNRLGVGIREFANSMLMDQLVKHDPELNLSSNEIASEGVEELVESPPFSKVKTLILDQNPVRDSGLSHLIRSFNTRNLQTIGLVNCGLSDDSIREMANSPLMGRLQKLDLRGNLITRESVDRLQEMSRRKLSGGTLTIKTDDELLTSRPSLSSLLWQMQRRES
ncbi:TIGR02996 domain-containing protein [Zavarzinella formosa]|uniref:TIGR02996 domain-containing protein n=1 Tax=Zavarzinella formosa TaxID=360055 RepID=UPI0002ECB26F|nr:TIGR02996 domain-containing protein [Zavarzinella formosa]